jgi:hypothetical protein
MTKTGRPLSDPYSATPTFSYGNPKGGKIQKCAGEKFKNGGNNSILADSRKANPRLKALKRGFLYMCKFKKVFTTKIEGGKIQNIGF